VLLDLVFNHHHYHHLLLLRRLGRLVLIFAHCKPPGKAKGPFLGLFCFFFILFGRFRLIFIEGRSLSFSSTYEIL